MTNLLYVNREEFEKRWFVRVADSEGRYWFDLRKNTLDQYLANNHEEFSIALIGSRVESNNYYVIPFKVVKHLFTEESLYPDGRWMGSVKNGYLKIQNTENLLDVSNYYGRALDIISLSVKNYSKAEEVDYLIENQRRFLNIRIKQSVFRKKVASNFQNRCCLTGIIEESMLVASHIIPWSKNPKCRLDPANGLFLFTLYDGLFDKGYISFTDDLKVIISPMAPQFSPALQSILKEVKGRMAEPPIKWRIKPKYLSYHRDNVLI